VRLDITRYAVVAFFVVVVLAAAAAGIAALVVGWARSLLRAAPTVAAIGLLLTGLATVNLGVPRPCSDDPPVRTRPVVSALVGDACERVALGQVQAVLLLAVATSLAVHVAATPRPLRPALT
jgi:ABC-type uncharacterized transport system permease subunit